MKPIEKGDIICAALEATVSSKMKELFENMPALVLIVPIIASEIENIIFNEKEEK